MDYPQLETNVCDMSSWYDLPDITYPTPPYISLREDIGPTPHPPYIRPRQFMDTMKKFDSIITLTTENVTLDKEVKYKRISKFDSTIHDMRFKWFVLDAASGQLKAKALQGANDRLKATFEISSYVPMDSNVGKKPTTLKIKGKNLYLSINQSGVLQLETTENLDYIEGPRKRFLFYRTGDNVTNTTFESAMSQGFFISTMAQGDSSVTAASGTPTNTTQIIDFVMDSELYGGLLNLGFKRISLQPPRKLSPGGLQPMCSTRVLNPHVWC